MGIIGIGGASRIWESESEVQAGYIGIGIGGASRIWESEVQAGSEVEEDGVVSTTNDPTRRSRHRHRPGDVRVTSA